MNKMLRLKDLFKIDFSSKGGGKLADKIFNKYNITKEEREEVKNEIASGNGGGGDSEEVEYYRLGSIDGPGILTELQEKCPNIQIANINSQIDVYSSIVMMNSYEVVFACRTDQYSAYGHCGNLIRYMAENKQITNILYMYCKTNNNVVNSYPTSDPLRQQLDVMLSNLPNINELKSITYKITKEEYDKAFNYTKENFINNQ